MPVGIVKLANNTSRTIHYHNLESDYILNLKPTDHNENTDYIRMSEYRDDTVPYRTSSHIEVWIGDDKGSKVEISDDNRKFYVVGRLHNRAGRHGVHHGKIGNGERFVLRVDGFSVGDTKQCGLTFYKYYDNKEFQPVFIALAAIVQMIGIGATIMLAFF